MNISSNTLFHYTRTFEYLQSIFENGFEFRNITETIPCLDESMPINNLTISHSAICFCDIPLSLTSDHIGQYGEYSIGLTKDWAIRNRITPIRYIHKNTPDATNNVLFLVLDKYNKMKLNNQNIIDNLIEESINEGLFTREEFIENKEIPKWCEKLLNTFSYIYHDFQNHIIKQSAYYRTYEGIWIDRKDGKEQNRVFYNEREWRAIKKTSPHLSFELDDISKIIVKEENEVESIVEIIKQKFNITSKDERKLLRKIFTHADIFGDI